MDSSKATHMVRVDHHKEEHHHKVMDREDNNSLHKDMEDMDRVETNSMDRDLLKGIKVGLPKVEKDHLLLGMDNRQDKEVNTERVLLHRVIKAVLQVVIKGDLHREVNKAMVPLLHLEDTKEAHPLDMVVRLLLRVDHKTDTQECHLVREVLHLAIKEEFHPLKVKAKVMVKVLVIRDTMAGADHHPVIREDHLQATREAHLQDIPDNNQEAQLERRLTQKKKKKILKHLKMMSIANRLWLNGKNTCMILNQRTC